ncbi:MAG: hypothetical protein ACYC6C_01165 [Coriobacteriia bacterium]
MPDPVAIPLLATAALVVALTGITLHRSGRPYRTEVLTAHKLVDLAAMVLLGWIVFDASQAARLSHIAWTATALTAALLGVSLIAGGAVSASDRAPGWVAWVHRVGSWLAVLMTAWWAVLFLG